MSSGASQPVGTGLPSDSEWDYDLVESASSCPAPTSVASQPAMLSYGTGQPMQTAFNMPAAPPTPAPTRPPPHPAAHEAPGGAPQPVSGAAQHAPPPLPPGPLPDAAAHAAPGGAPQCEELHEDTMLGPDLKYRDQLVGAYRLLMQANAASDTMVMITDRPGAAPLQDLLRDARAAQLHDARTGWEAIQIITELCHAEGIRPMRSQHLSLGVVDNPAAHEAPGVPPQLASGAAQSAQPPSPLGPPPHAAAHAAPGGAPQPADVEIFTQENAATLRRTSQGVHAQMRDLLNCITAEQPVHPVGDSPNAPLRVEVPPLTPWRHYLAHHKESQAMIGPGVRAFYSQFRRRNDANRATGQGDQLRLDFVVERARQEARQRRQGPLLRA